MVVYQRNHLGVLSNYPPLQIGGLFTYDFTSSADKAYGVDGHKEIATGKWGMYSGDGNANGIVGLNDINIIWNNGAGSTGYLKGDFNLDAQVDNKDKNDFWLPNMGEGSQIPE